MSHRKGTIKMTLDEAIKHAEEVAEKNEKDANWGMGNICIDRSSCLKCAKEHRQLAEWLYELKLYRMHGTVAKIDGKWYVSDDPKLKTVHGKTGEVVIGGFKEVKSRCKRL